MVCIMLQHRDILYSCFLACGFGGFSLGFFVWFVFLWFCSFVDLGVCFSFINSKETVSCWLPYLTHFFMEVLF